MIDNTVDFIALTLAALSWESSVLLELNNIYLLLWCSEYVCSSWDILAWYLNWVIPRFKLLEIFFWNSYKNPCPVFEPEIKDNTSQFWSLIWTAIWLGSHSVINQSSFENLFLTNTCHDSWMCMLHSGRSISHWLYHISLVEHLGNQPSLLFHILCCEWLQKRREARWAAPQRPDVGRSRWALISMTIAKKWIKNNNKFRLSVRSAKGRAHKWRRGGPFPSQSLHTHGL